MIHDSNIHENIILYSKYWYQRTDLVEDLKTIVMSYTGIPIEYVSLRNILHFVIETFKQYDNIENIYELIEYDIFRFNDSITITDMIGYLIGKLNIINKPDDKSVEEWIGKPNPKVLPLPKREQHNI